MAKTIVAGELYESLTGKLFEIGRQLHQPSGYPFDPEQLNAHLQAAVEGRWFGEQFFRETGELTIQIPALARPTLAELRVQCPWIREEDGIERDTSPTDAVTLKLSTVLRVGEGSINGGEYEQRIAGKLDIILGYQQAVWLVEHQDEFPGFMALLGKIYIDFTGLVVVDAAGDRLFPYLRQNGKRWYLGWHWFDDGFGSYGRVAFSGQ